jgi:alpha-glucosidase
VKGRDGCRVPIPWTTTGASFGFGAGDAQPWLPQPAWFADTSVAAQDGMPGSTLEMYRSAMRLRRTDWVGAGRLEWSDKFNDPEAQVLAFRRGGLLCIVNFGDESIAMPGGDVLLVSIDHDGDSRLPGAAAAWIRLA